MESFIQDLTQRGLIQNMTEGLAEALAGGSCRAYIGFDPTAPSLTIGNLVTLLLLKRFQLAGHQPVVLMGGATGRIGDPSFKDEERKLLDLETLERNLEAQRQQFLRFLDFEGPQAAIFVNNYDIYKDMSVFTFLRDIGKQITINYMMSKDSVKNRLETGLSFTEFSYQLIQGYDFLYLLENQNCILQMGGGDQWGNITTGLELIRKAGLKAHGLTTPLLTRADGKKFGKSEEGNIWLDANLTSPYRFYQFWLNLPDQDLPRLWRTFSFRSLSEIEAIEAEHTENPNAQKRLLAAEITVLVHGNQALKAAEAASQVAFSPKLNSAFLQSLDAQTFELLAQELPHIELSKSLLEQNTNILDLLVEHSQIMPSKSEARRALKSNALALNTEKIQSENLSCQMEMLLQNRYVLFEHGKKKKYLLSFV